MPVPRSRFNPSSREVVLTVSPSTAYFFFRGGSQGPREGRPGVRRDAHGERAAALRLPAPVQPLECRVHRHRGVGRVPAVLGVVERGAVAATGGKARAP